MLSYIPEQTELLSLLEPTAYEAWDQLCTFIQKNYIMDTQWNLGRKENIYEYKFRKSGKTLCALYVRKSCFGFLMIFGKQEREKFEQEAATFAPEIQEAYEKEPIYHDGKWVMFQCKDSTILEDFKRMLQIKKRPNRKNKI